MKKTKKKLSRKQKIWHMFCKLPRIEQYEIVHDIEDVYDDFRYMLDDHQFHYESLADFERDIKRRSKAKKRKK